MPETATPEPATGLGNRGDGDRLNRGTAGPSAGTPPPRFAIPSLSLPKGGGAIRGIDEAFLVQSATGTAGLSVPLPLSPARGGTAPSIHLEYDSGSGNGPFGFGWSLSCPEISRKTDKGLPRYSETPQPDVFRLSGAEDLVPLLQADGTQLYRYPVTLFGVPYRVYPYRPRIEAEYTRIERWVAPDGDTHWRCTTRDNIVSLFGEDGASRVSDPADQTHVFTWKLCRTWDDKGNTALYQHVAEDSRGIDLDQAHETNRTLGRTAQRYLKSVVYGNVQPYLVHPAAAAPPALPADWLFKVVLDYGDHRATAPAPAPDLDWPVRPDPFSAYRAGFEIRTYRRVARILMFHNFPDEPRTGGADQLVRALGLAYADTDPQAPVFSFIATMARTSFGHAGNPVSDPPLALTYSRAQLQSTVQTLDPTSAVGLPEGFAGGRATWIDLDGEGLPGILTETPRAWQYKRNLASAPEADGDTLVLARFAAPELLASLPTRSGLHDGGQALLDLSGGGLPDVVAWSDPLPGFWGRDEQGGFAPFRRFCSLPQLDWQDPNLRLVDLTGDGLADILVTAADVYTLYPGLGETGFGVPQTVRIPWDEEKGPRLVLADGTGTIFLADLSGDGLSDLVRIQNGESSYWPNLGYGRFGPRVCMDNAPRFGPDAQFDARRIRLADIDGSGGADLLYLGADGVTVWYNHSGNAWSAPTQLAVFPGMDLLANVDVLDLLGTGTACLVWSSPLPTEAQALRYVDLMGGSKPHLLTGIVNNMGAETRIAYAPSTRFYRWDADAGTPWVTRLPFPVQVVARAEHIHWIGCSRLVSTYSYHHGYFDGFEREFRGFGRVDQWDAEEFPAPDPTLFQNEDVATWSPPVLTRTWFHTGAFLQGPEVSRQYAAEYWTQSGAGSPPALPDTAIPAGLDPFEMQEAYRALKGHTLRVEVFAPGATASLNAAAKPDPRPSTPPFTVTETNFSLRCLQPRGASQHAAFAVDPRETVTIEYDETDADPRMTHRMVLETGAYGDVLRSVAISYPRRQDAPPGPVPPGRNPPPALPPAAAAMLLHDQGRLRIRATSTDYTNPIDDAGKWPFTYRAPLPSATDTAELTGIAAPPDGTLLTFDRFDRDRPAPGATPDPSAGWWWVAWFGGGDIPFEAVPAADIDGGGPGPAALTRRLIAQTRTLYRADSLAGLLPPDCLESLALAGQTYAARFTPGLLGDVFGPLVTDAMLLEGGYVALDTETGWWAPGVRAFLSPGSSDTPAQELAHAQAHFFQPCRTLDPFGAVATLTYDAYDLLPLATTDPVGNVVSVVNDYRVLAPATVVDPNRNCALAAYDARGQVTATAVTDPTGTKGDSLTGFDLDPDAATIAADLASPLANPAALLGNATTRIVADPWAYLRDGGPPAVHTMTRETHVSDLADAATRIQHAIAYGDGTGRNVQRKALVAPGPILPGGPALPERWAVTAWTILDNKGRTVRRYEPFFSSNPAFEPGQQVGVCTTTLYDPLGRVVATLRPDQSWEKTVRGPWRQDVWDANDTLGLGDPRADPDVGRYFVACLTGPFESWAAQRIGGTFGDTAEQRAAQQDAARKAMLHANTPTLAFFDPDGQVCLSAADDGSATLLPCRTALDAGGKPLAVFDTAGRRAQENVLRLPLPSGGFRYVAGTDMAGAGLYSVNQDAGARRVLSDVTGKPIRSWDARGHAFRLTYDAARRPVARTVSTGGGPDILLGLAIYGEQQPDPNLRGRLFRQYDGAGFTENSAFDFKGNLVASRRQLAADYHAAIDWSPLVGLVAASDLDGAAAGAGLVPRGDGGRDSFVAATVFDALDRPIQAVMPHSASMQPDVVRRGYDQAGLPLTVDVWLQQAGAPAALLDPATADRHAVTAIDYDAHGRRVSMDYGNGTHSDFIYDPQSFRLAGLVTTRAAPIAPAAQTVQALLYFYDPIGNVTTIRDDADTQDVVFFRNQRIEPSAGYTYDPLYRLTQATGREHVGQTGGGGPPPPRQVTNDDSFCMLQPLPGDGTAMANYTETYAYDGDGNILSMTHQVGPGQWVRRYAYTEPSQIVATEIGNRLSATSLPGDPASGPFSATYAYDAHGSMTRMPHLPSLVWDEDDRLRSTTRGMTGTGVPQTTFYAYDAAASRVRKATDAQAGAGQTTRRSAERIYLGGTELYREFAPDGTTVTLQSETLRVDAGAGTVVLIETRTVGSSPAPAQRVRYQFGNHLGSAVLELDDQAAILTYEEYFPFGSTSYQSGDAVAETSKRYRYTGKERDAENDLYYHGARYLAPWLGRWTACDPNGRGASANLSCYVRNRPTSLVDPTGTTDEPGWFAQTIGPGSWIGQAISHASYPGSSFFQDDRKLEAVQHVAEGVTIAAASVATGGLAAEAAAGYATAAGASTLQVAMASGAAETVAMGATTRFGTTGLETGSLQQALGAAADPKAVIGDAAIGAAMPVAMAAASKVASALVSPSARQAAAGLATKLDELAKDTRGSVGRLSSAATNASDAAAAGLINAEKGQLGHQTHNVSASVKDALGQPRRAYEAAHDVPEAALKALGKSPGKGTTTILPRETHRMIDFGSEKTGAGWVQTWNQAQASGQEITASDLNNMVSEAIMRVPEENLGQAAKGTMQWHLYDQLFNQLELEPRSVIVPGIKKSF